MKSMKKSLFSSVVVMLLCVSMLIGTTFAWFTDSASSKNNVIQTGKLDAEMYWSDELLDADSDDWNNASNATVFNYNNWEPGYTDVKYIKVANAGTLNFKWKLTIEANGTVTDLSDVIDVYYINNLSGAVTTLAGLTKVGTLTEVMADKTNNAGSLAPDASAIFAIAFHMDDNAGNTYQGKSLCENGFSLKLQATQEIGEFDSFGNDYDIDAAWEESMNQNINVTAVQTLSDNATYVDGALANEVNIAGTNGVSATVPANVVVADGASALTLSVKTVETTGNFGTDANAKSLDVHIDGIAADNTVPMVVNLGAVLPAGIPTNEVKFYHTENDTAILMTRVNSVEDFQVHNEYVYNAATGEVTIYVKSFSVFSFVQAMVSYWGGTSNEEWFNLNDYNATKTFSIMEAEDLARFRDLVDAGYTFEGKTVNLEIDIDLQGDPETGANLFDPIGFGYTYGKNLEKPTAFMGTFDGQGHVIYNLYQNGWDLCPQAEKDDKSYATYAYSTAGGGLFASIENATIKNVAMSGANIVFECVDIGVLVGYAQGVCTFENIAIADSKIANYNRATGAVVGEVCYGYADEDGKFTNSKGDKQDYSHTFTNITVYPTVKVSSLWGSFDTLCGGVIGGKWDNNGSKVKVLMNNVTTAAEMDVFSDVTAAYQWYAYRRCGMLIGHTEQDSPKQGLNLNNHADAEFLVCENVTVYYGDWVNYDYYRYDRQDSDTGKRYPWVRAQAGEHNNAFSNPRYGVPTVNGIKITAATNSAALYDAYTPIVFNQLYGGGQGVYGRANHTGVTIVNINDASTKTVYIYNNNGWSNLELSYNYNANDGNNWTTVVGGIVIYPTNIANVYKVVVPSSASTFTIIGTKDGMTYYKVYTTANCENNATYDLDGKLTAGGNNGNGDGTTTPDVNG